MFSVHNCMTKPGEGVRFGVREHREHSHFHAYFLGVDQCCFDLWRTGFFGGCFSLNHV